ncbi:MAG: hypothetical protein C0608_08005 [Deltaproteobacteria bacterium]|nr:MAG: hypothetical protein C0608_08005 [Deltaproteobacteria bacterium]
MECRKQGENSNCACTYTSCARHGICCECIEYHRSKGQMVACYFTPEAEGTYDRSIKHFIEDYKG